MAKGRKRASSPALTTPFVEPASETVGEDDEGPIARPLRFAETITWTPGKPIAIGQLLRRLKALSEELSEFEQGEGGHQSFKQIAKALASTQLLGNKDAGVRAWTLFCITQVFSIAVPEAPYTAQQLQAIFTIFTKEVLPALADATNSYRQQYLDALDLLVEDRSIILILDVPDSDKLVLALFKKTFDITAGATEVEADEALPNNIEYKLVKLLSEIITEADSLQPEVIEVVLAQFMHFASYRDDQDLDLLQAQTYPTSYTIARSVCSSCSNRMARYVSEYFTTVLINATDLDDGAPVAKTSGKKKDDDHAARTRAITADDLNDARKAHLLLRELWRSCPDVVQGVVPQIEAELGAEDHNMRSMAVEVVGDMTAGIGAIGPPQHIRLDPTIPIRSDGTTTAPTTWTGLFKPSAPHSFAAAYPTCYQAFLDRSRDKSQVVRAAFATGAGHIFATDAGGRGMNHEERANLATLFAMLLRDHDEKPRLAAVNAVASLDFPALIELLSQEFSDTTTISSVLCERIQDVKPAIHTACTDLLARAWGVASEVIEHDSTALSRALGNVPTQILLARWKDSKDLNLAIILAFYDLLLPATYPNIKSSEAKVPDSQPKTAATESAALQDPDHLRAKRILLLFKSLNGKAVAIFNLFQKLRSINAKCLTAMLDSFDFLDELDEAEKHDEHNLRVAKAAQVLSQPLPDQTMADGHLRQLGRQDKRVRHLIRLAISPASDHIKVVRSLRELRRNFAKQPERQRAIWQTLEPVLTISAMHIFNRSHVPAFTHFARTNEDDLAEAADEIIKEIAKLVPEVLDAHISDLYEELQQSQPTNSKPGTTRATSNALKSCVNYARQFQSSMTQDRAFYQAMVAYALYGSPLAAKQAITIIVLAAPKKELLIDRIVQECIKSFQYGQNNYTTRLAALAQLRLLAGEQTEQYADEIMKIATADVLSHAHVSTQQDDLVWSDDLDDDLMAKILALKVLVNSLRGKLATDGSAADLEEVARPPYQLLTGLIARQGEMTTEDSSPQHHRAHLRLAAGKMLLKLARERRCDRLLSSAEFSLLARLCQDKRPEVRSEFAKALRKYLRAGQLPSRYLALVFLYAHEPLKNIRADMQRWIISRHVTSNKDGQSVHSFDTVLPILLSLLTHHEFFGTGSGDLEDSAQYITFYLLNVATPENLSMIYNMAQKLKTVEDGIDPTKSDDLYLICDLAEAVIRSYQDEKGWSLQATDAKVKIPAGFFTALPRDVDAQALAEKQFLSNDMVEMIPDIVRAQMKIKRRKQDRIAVSSTKGNGVQKAKAARKKISDVNRRVSKRSAESDESETDGTPQRKKSRSSVAAPEAQRRSSRTTAASKSYAEADSDDDDAEMVDWDKDMAGEENKENLDLAMEESEPDDDHEKTANVVKAMRPAKSTKTSVTPRVDETKAGRKSTRTSGRLHHVAA